MGDRTARVLLPSWATTVSADANVLAARSAIRWTRDALAVLGYFGDDIPSRFVVAEHLPPRLSQFASLAEYVDYLRERHRTGRDLL